MFWPLLPRLFAPAVLGFFVLTVIPSGPRGRLRGQSAMAVAAASLACLCVLGATIPATLTWGQADADAPVQAQGVAPAAKQVSDWRYYGPPAVDLILARTLDHNGESILGHMLRCQASFPSYNAATNSYSDRHGLPQVCYR